MKISSKTYAKVLAEFMVEKKADKKIVDNFLKLLVRNGDLKKAKEIISLAEALYFKKTGKRKIILETARKTDKTTAKRFLKSTDIVEEKINPELIAGIKIIVNNEKQLDFSLQKKLDEIFE